MREVNEQLPTWTSTLWALSSPRRLVPVALLATALLFAQWRMTSSPLGLPVGLAMVLSFWFIAPHAWRVLFSAARPHRSVPLARFLAYIVVAVTLVYVTGYALPAVVGLGLTFLTDRFSLLVEFALFIVGGWGLGRDIEMEGSLARAESRAEQLAREAERAQLLALRSHLDPHFLFNTLNAIAEWCREDGEVAERATLSLSAMLRAVLEGVQQESWSLAREIALLDMLLDLYLIRDPGFFTLDRHVPDPMPAIDLPPMILLPLVENAMKHGPTRGHRGRLLLAVDVGPSEVSFVIENPGAYGGRRDGGEGLSMVERHLALAYDGLARLDIEGRGDRTRATVTFPKKLPRAEVGR